MRRSRCTAAIWAGGIFLAIFHAAVSAQSISPAFSLTPDSPSVYSPPSVYQPMLPPREDEGINNGGVTSQIIVRYLTDDVYRGVSHNQAAGGDRHAANFQADTQLSFNLGKLHPYVGVVANVNDSDPVSRFQEIRPVVGLEYALRPLIFNVGHNTYIYPERENVTPSPNTSEVFFKLSLDDSYFFLTPDPVLSPYIYTAYDYQRNKGFYIEAGLKHDFVFEDAGFILTGFGDVGFLSNFAQQFVTVSPQDSGFQHYDIGIIGTFSLNNLFQFSPRYGDFSLQGYLTYTGKFANAVLANHELWGGVGLVF